MKQPIRLATMNKDQLLEFQDLVAVAVDAGEESVALFGKAAQAEMVAEECAELITAIQQRKRGRVSEAAVCEEIADVLLTAITAMGIYGVKDTLSALAFKINRLDQRMQKYKSTLEYGYKNIVCAGCCLVINENQKRYSKAAFNGRNYSFHEGCDETTEPKPWNDFEKSIKDANL